MSKLRKRRPVYRPILNFGRRHVGADVRRSDRGSDSMQTTRKVETGNPLIESNMRRAAHV
jgi:hypothetical protein